MQITATVKPEGEKLKWQDNPALSCTECANPTARPTTTTMFTVTTPEADCPGSASVTVEVLPPAIIDLVPEIQICLGDSVRLNRAPAEPGVTYIWMANPPGGLLPNTSSITVSPTQRTGYVLIAEGPQKCVSTQVSAVTPLQATINAGPDLKGCAGVPLTLNATVTGAVGTVVWSPGQCQAPL